MRFCCKLPPKIPKKDIMNFYSVDVTRIGAPWVASAIIILSAVRTHTKCSVEFQFLCFSGRFSVLAVERGAQLKIERFPRYQKLVRANFHVQKLLFIHTLDATLSATHKNRATSPCARLPWRMHSLMVRKIHPSIPSSRIYENANVISRMFVSYACSGAGCRWLFSRAVSEMWQWRGGCISIRAHWEMGNIASDAQRMKS